ncbi:MAG: hypothetical protein LQ338_006463 [Usnochroma carphineum]|nr:MAG: hypothetical protein LQ338_006463 [Usnochroma carphineum]
MMFIFWGVTPLVSSVFAPSIVAVEKQATATTTASLMPLKDQSPSLDTNFMMTAYGIIWLGQALPEYVTRDGALEPFEMENVEATKLVNSTWTARTRLYGTSLDCEEAEITKHPDGNSYSNKKACKTVPGILNMYPESEYGGMYIGYNYDQRAGPSLSGCGCSSPTNSHLFLALWGKSWEYKDTNTTAFFCEPQYWVQDVNATVTLSNMNVSNVVPLGPRVSLSDRQFNRSAFEYNIGSGEQPVSHRADISETTSFIDQEANLAGLGYNSTTTNMLGFALGLRRLSLAQYAEPRTLVSSFEDAHKLLHALAIKDLLTKDTSEHDSRAGVIGGKSNAIVVIRPIAIVVESLLGFVALLTIALYVQFSRRKSQLSKDPASLTDLLTMMPQDLSGCNIQDCHMQTSKDSRARLSGGKIRLPPMEGSACQLPIVNGKSTETSSGKAAGIATSYPNQQGDPQHVRPFEMSLIVAFAFLVVLGTSLMGLVVLKVAADKHRGLPMPSHSTVVNQLVLNYVPIIFATFLEPFWLLLNRLLCVLQPFQELLGADTKSSRSLDLRYTSLPPQLIFWRAFRARHYVLTSVCAIGLSANLLAVSLNGLFNTSLVSLVQPMTLSPKHKPVFQYTPQRTTPQEVSSDYQYIAKTNISDGVELPPWTVPTRYFVPFTRNPKSDHGGVQAYRATTQGFGIEANCEQATYNDTAFVTGQQKFWYTEERTPIGRSVTCGGFPAPAGGQNNSHSALEDFHQLYPLSLYHPLYGSNDESSPDVGANTTEDETLTCMSISVAGFLRGNLSVSHDSTETEKFLSYPEILKINVLSSVWMTCRPKLISGPYLVTVDKDGYVKSYEAVGPNEEDLSSFFVDGTTPLSLLAAATSILSEGRDTIPYWHNDTFVDTWFAYFVKHLSNSTIFVDPAAPVPPFDSVKPYVEDIYSRLFAIVLSLNQDWLSPADEGSTISGKMIISTQRVLVSSYMFVITVTLLALNMLVAVAYWSTRPKRMLPRMPYTIASIMDLFKGSGLVSDVENSVKWEKDWRFGYGRFVGVDGKPYTGIERRPFVIPFSS